MWGIRNYPNESFVVASEDELLQFNRVASANCSTCGRHALLRLPTIPICFGKNLPRLDHARRDRMHSSAGNSPIPFQERNKRMRHLFVLFGSIRLSPLPSSGNNFPMLQSLTFTLLLVSLCAPAHAVITWTGDIDPNDPNTWTSSTYGYIGKTADGTLTVDGGSGLESKYGYIGYESSSTGQATVVGLNSSWSNSGHLSVGFNGDGTLVISDGGTVSSPGSSIGNVSGSTGHVTVDGNGSTWTDSDDLYIGHKGDGTLNISSGGTCERNQGYLGC